MPQGSYSRGAWSYAGELLFRVWPVASAQVAHPPYYFAAELKAAVRYCV